MNDGCLLLDFLPQLLDLFIVDVLAQLAHLLLQNLLLEHPVFQVLLHLLPELVDLVSNSSIAILRHYFSRVLVPIGRVSPHVVGAVVIRHLGTAPQVLHFISTSLHILN